MSDSTISKFSLSRNLVLQLVKELDTVQSQPSQHFDNNKLVHSNECKLIIHFCKMNSSEKNVEIEMKSLI